MLEELTFTKEEWKESPFSKDEDASFWVGKGRPVLWVEEYNDDHVKAYYDVAYGKLKLIVDGEICVSNIGQVVVCRNYSLFSSYYGDEYEGKVFKQIN